MDILFMIVCLVIVLSVLIFIHEGGHYLASKAFGVRVTEFMIGLPGPSIGFTRAGTRFGVTAVPLGGYAKVCGMGTGKLDPRLQDVLCFVFEKGETSINEISEHLDINEEQSDELIEELIEWGSIQRKGKRGGEKNVIVSCASVPSAKEVRFAKRMGLAAPVRYDQGEPRIVEDKNHLFEKEYSVQYRSLPFWKRSVILLAGIFVNLLFAVLAFIVIYSVIGIDVTNPQTQELVHMHATPLQAIQAGFNVIAVTFVSILGLFNPETAAQTVSNSTSIVGIAVMSADYFAQGVTYALFFMALISISLGLMNLLPIPPLDGGRFLVEIIQRITRRDIPPQALGYISLAGMALFTFFFIFMLNQDIQRFVLGNW